MSAETHQEMSLPLTAGQTLTTHAPRRGYPYRGRFSMGGRVEAVIHLRGADPDALQEALRAYSLLNWNRRRKASA